MFQIKGIIRDIYQTQTFGKGFTKREFILSVRRGENNIEDIKFECHADKVNLLDQFAGGELASLEFYISGKEWNGKHFNNLVCYGIEHEQGETQREVTSLPKEEQKKVDEDVPF